MNNPSIYQLNTRVLLQERGVALGRPATLDDLEDRFLDDIAARGSSGSGPSASGRRGRRGGRSPARTPSWSRSAGACCPICKDEDICGSPFAIVAYETNHDFGGDKALAHLRERLARRNLKLLLDFVPNHTAPDHPWVTKHPEYYIQGSEDDLARQPQNYARVKQRRGRRRSSPTGAIPTSTAGRTPSSSTTATPAFARRASPSSARSPIAATASAATWRCCCSRRSSRRPGATARCPADGSPPKDNPFWPEAIAAIKRRHPEFMFVAEVYWDMEWELQQAGFDYTYDKRLYDRLVAAGRPRRCAST